MILTLDIPFPPGEDAYFSRSYIDGKIQFSLTDVGRHYRRSVENAWYASNQQKVFDGRHITIRLKIYPPDKRKRMIEKIPGVVLNSIMRAGMFSNKCIVDEIIITRCDKLDGGRVGVTVVELSNEGNIE